MGKGDGVIELLQLTVWIGAHVDATCADDSKKKGCVENLIMTRKEDVRQETCTLD